MLLDWFHVTFFSGWSGADNGDDVNVIVLFLCVRICFVFTLRGGRSSENLDAGADCSYWTLWLKKKIKIKLNIADIKGIQCWKLTPKKLKMFEGSFVHWTHGCTLLAFVETLTNSPPSPLSLNLFCRLWRMKLWWQCFVKENVVLEIKLSKYLFYLCHTCWSNPWNKTHKRLKN